MDREGSTGCGCAVVALILHSVVLVGVVFYAAFVGAYSQPPFCDTPECATEVAYLDVATLACVVGYVSTLLSYRRASSPKPFLIAAVGASIVAFLASFPASAHIKGLTLLLPFTTFMLMIHPSGLLFLLHSEGWRPDL